MDTPFAPGREPRARCWLRSLGWGSGRGSRASLFSAARPLRGGAPLSGVSFPDKTRPLEREDVPASEGWARFPGVLLGVKEGSVWICLTESVYSESERLVLGGVCTARVPQASLRVALTDPAPHPPPPPLPRRGIRRTRGLPRGTGAHRAGALPPLAEGGPASTL